MFLGGVTFEIEDGLHKGDNNNNDNKNDNKNDDDNNYNNNDKASRFYHFLISLPLLFYFYYH